VPTWSSSPTRTDPTKGAEGHHLVHGRGRHAEGFTRGRKLDKVGQEESDTAELFFQDVRVPDSQPHRATRAWASSR
jgi:alkylation response protein AidB-like acyl-CoA dehydrogenase